MITSHPIAMMRMINSCPETPFARPASYMTLFQFAVVITCASRDIISRDTLIHSRHVRKSQPAARAKSAHLEHSRYSVQQAVESVPWDRARRIRGACDVCQGQVCVSVKHEPVSKHLHPEQREDVYDEDEQHREICEVHDRARNRPEQLPQADPAARELEHAKQAQGPQRRRGALGVQHDARQDARRVEREINERDRDDKHVKHVELVANVDPGAE